DSLGTYQRGDASFHLMDDEGVALPPVPFGTAGRPDVWPITGDFDGDGRDTVGLYQQADAAFVVLVDAGVASAPLVHGTPGRVDALPVAGDWNGDGRDSVGLFQQADGTLSLLDDTGAPVDPGAVVTPAARPEGTTPADAFPVAGDWDGDGRDSVGVMWRGAAMFDLPVPDAADPNAARTVATDVAPAPLPVAGDWNGNALVTLEELRQIYGAIPDEAKVVEGLPALNAAMMRAGISTPARKAAFLATLRSESGFRFDASEYGNDSRYRGRGFIQLTGRSNYRAAGEFLGLDLAGDPDLATNGLVSPLVAAWYWTVARDINLASDRLDMAAVNIAVGYRPSEQRDMIRCADFMAALRFYSGGGRAPDGVNCERTPASRALAFSTVAPPSARRWLPGASRTTGAPSGTVATMEGTTLLPAPVDPAAPPAAPGSPPQTLAAPGPQPAPQPAPPPAAPPGPPAVDPTTTSEPSTTTSEPSTTTSVDPTTSSSATTTSTSTAPVSTEPSGTTTAVDPDVSTTTTLFDGQYDGG
ncbi:MAG TPA: glycoside hydrolase family 19 protein, partial [Acidimicrobiales bacterium]|nr:glycoside hydrolase family 19 protein [Acidimicrobiales bacterium]